MKKDEYETRGGIKRWVCANCNTSNSQTTNKKYCRECGVLIDNEIKTHKQAEYYKRIKGKKRHEKIEPYEI